MFGVRSRQSMWACSRLTPSPDGGCVASQSALQTTDGIVTGAMGVYCVGNPAPILLRDTFHLINAIIIVSQPPDVRLVLRSCCQVGRVLRDRLLRRNLIHRHPLGAPDLGRKSPAPVPRVSRSSRPLPELFKYSLNSIPARVPKRRVPKTLSISTEPSPSHIHIPSSLSTTLRQNFEYMWENVAAVCFHSQLWTLHRAASDVYPTQ